VIIAMDPSIKKPRKKKNLQYPNDPLDLYHPSVEDIPAFPDRVMFAMAQQVDQGAMINEAFYAKFLAYFTSDGEGRDIQNKMTWLHRLPSMSTDGTNTALTLALRATATAYCGSETRNPTVLEQAWKYYGQALQAHARILARQRLAKQEIDKEVTVHMVSTSVMLSLFEAMQSTTSEAYREHINGAVKMLEVTGPGQCLEGVLCQLFFHIRTQMAFVYLTTQKSEAIPVKKILVENLSYRRLPIFQQLMSHIATLAEIYVAKTSPGSKQQLIDLSVYEFVKREVEALWLEYQEQAESRSEQLLFVAENGYTMFRDGFTALCVAYFSAARVLFKVLAPRVAATYIDPIDHFDSILSSARFLKTKRIGCAYMRMATPLYLVSLHSPNVEQRTQAIGIFEDWKKGSMAGISAQALTQIYKRQDMFLPVGAEEMVKEIHETTDDSFVKFGFEQYTDDSKNKEKYITSAIQPPT
jgi:hypothetical protein